VPRSLILATDPDREGEAISWHVLEALNQKRVLKGTRRSSASPSTPSPSTPCRRLMKPPRQIDQRAGRRLSGASRTRLSRRLHPVAGAVAQAPRRPLGRPRAVCRAAPGQRPRARDREAFVAREYWSLVATLLTTAAARAFEARLSRRRRQEDHAPRHRLPARKPKTSRKALEAARFKVAEVEAKPVRRNPQPPFRPRPCSRKPAASSASRRPTPCASRSASMKASISAARPPASSPICEPTACRSRSAITQARKVIGEELRQRLCAGRPPSVQVKAKNAQEAHEAIRPTDLGGCRPWSRAISSRIRPSSMS
jgi:DNA topoisomerase-1